MESKLNTRRQRCTHHAAGPEIVFLGVVYTPKPDAAQATPFRPAPRPFYTTVLLERPCRTGMPQCSESRKLEI